MAFIKDDMIALLNYRINEEEKSARLYLAMSEWLGYNGFAGASALWFKYYEEEIEHAEKAYKFLRDLDILPKVDEIPKPQLEFESLQSICKLSYDHEILITEQCNELAMKSKDSGDFMTFELAMWYMEEQRDEIEKTVYWLDRLEAFGDSPEALRLLDNEMGQEAKND